RGLTGIGKTWLVAQWLQVAHRQYELVLYTSVPDYAADQLGATKWFTGAITELAERLAARWGRSSLLQKLTYRPELVTSAEDLVDALVEALQPGRFLWVIDDGQFLLNDDGGFVDERAARLVASVAEGRWPSCKLLFVGNRRLIAPGVGEYHLDDGFTFQE